MSLSNQRYEGSRVYRLDRFAVPRESRDEFLMRVGQTHEILRRQAGFVRDLLLERVGEDGATVVVTMVEWESQEAVDRVVPIVRAEHWNMGFNPKETIERLGVAADLGIYRPVERNAVAA